MLLLSPLWCNNKKGFLLVEPTFSRIYKRGRHTSVGYVTESTAGPPHGGWGLNKNPRYEGVFFEKKRGGDFHPSRDY